MIHPLPALVVALLLSLAVWPSATAQPLPGTPATADLPAATAYAVTPVLKPDHTRWRIGYVESGVYDQYPATLRAIVSGLQQLGWLELSDPMPEHISGESLWQWLGRHSRSNYLEFVPDAYWQPGNFISRQRPIMRQRIRTRITQKQDIDLLLAMGTWAGLDLRAIGPPVPTVIAAASDPLASGIIDSIQDSGSDMLHASVEPRRYQRQLRLFHDIVPFKKLGIVYENSKTGRTYTALNAVREVSAELGFDVIHCHADATNISTEQAMQNAVGCYQTLADQHVDAVYVTSHQGVTQTSIVNIVRILRDAGIPSFSMMGTSDVENGILLSMAETSLAYVGLFHARSMARIFNGALPRQLNQIQIDPDKIALNLTTARIIGFNPPIEILLAADQLYESPDIH